MDQRLSFVTLAVEDLDASRAFYCDGLGWEAALEVPGEVLMLQVADRVVLSLWDRRAFEAEVGPVRRGDGVAPLTLSHNCATRAEVDAALATARAAGADPVQPAEEREWGGWSGYFADPDGVRWEVAENPGPIGQVVLPPAPPASAPAAPPTAEQRRRLTDDEVAAALAEPALAAWHRDGDELVARWATAGFTTGMAFVNALAPAAEEADHHPDVLLTWPTVEVRLTSHDVGGLTSRDTVLAATIGALADGAGLEPERALGDDGDDDDGGG